MSSQNEENQACQGCENIPDEYIQLQCDHTFCLACLAYQYLNFLNEDEGEGSKQVVNLACEICKDYTELDKQTIETLEQVLQQILMQQEDDEIKQNDDEKGGIELITTNQNLSEEKLNGIMLESHEKIDENLINYQQETNRDNQFSYQDNSYQDEIQGKIQDFQQDSEIDDNQGNYRYIQNKQQQLDNNLNMAAYQDKNTKSKPILEPFKINKKIDSSKKGSSKKNSSIKDQSKIDSAIKEQQQNYEEKDFRCNRNIFSFDNQLQDNEQVQNINFRDIKVINNQIYNNINKQIQEIIKVINNYRINKTNNNRININKINKIFLKNNITNKIIMINNIKK